jgi:diacylglycerol kinase family enzyme
VTYRLDTAAGSRVGRAFVVLVSNNPYTLRFGGVKRRQRLDGGRLGVYVVPETRFRLAALLACVLFKFPAIAGQALEVTTATLTLDGPATAGLDGEPLLPEQTVWRFGSRRGELAVYVPAVGARQLRAGEREPVYTEGPH